MNDDERRERYLTEQEKRCPWCSSDNVSDGLYCHGWNSATQNMSCDDCEKVWKDIYTLTDILLPDEVKK